MKTFSLLLSFVFAYSISHCQGFIHNVGQWIENFNFKSTNGSSQVFIEKNALLFHLWDGVASSRYIEAAHDRKLWNNEAPIKNHAYRMKFIDANPNSVFGTSKPLKPYFNYYLGNDDSRWKTGVNQYEVIYIKELYGKIDLRIKRYGDGVKYDLLVHPGADINQLRWKYEGIETCKLIDGCIRLETSLGSVIENKPIAYSEINGDKQLNVPCNYKIDGNVVSFVFPEGYDKSQELIIDPVLVFCTFTGSTSDNWGFTATYDSHGNAYAAGVVFSQGYPTTLGAFQTSFNASVDIAISKFSQDGSTLLYATYLGGDRPEMPHSMIVDSANSLIVMGNTGSSNFPVTANAYDETFNGGSTFQTFSGLGNYDNGCDIFVAKFSSDGTSLLGSTYVGGAGNDGLNLGSSLYFNYSDEFRSEIALDEQQNIIVLSNTSSPDFPLQAAFQPSFGGGLMDVCLFRLNSTLTNLQFSSYFGGTGDDAGYGISLNAQGEYYFCGGTTSANLFTTQGVVSPTYLGSIDGYLTRFSPYSNTVLASTYLGTAFYNQAHFVQVDANDDIYVFGQSIGGYAIVPGQTGVVISDAGAGQFLHKLNPSLTTTLMSTCFGNAATQVNLVPSAFGVDDCGRIYLSGWGALLNPSSVIDLNGMPVTANAIKDSTDGKDFYLMILEQDAKDIYYGSFYGGSQYTGPFSGEHVDGGTSRFDKKGVLYQALCAGCGGSSNLPTSFGAYSAVNNSNNCNMAVLKFDFAKLSVQMGSEIPSATCIGSNIDFTAIGDTVVAYSWYFGDGDSSQLYNPSHVYTNPGTYTVKLMSREMTACINNDTAYFTIDVHDLPIIDAGNSISILSGNSTEIGSLPTASGNGPFTYNWQPSLGLNSNTIANPIATPSNTTEYYLTVTDFYGCENIDSITVTISGGFGIEVDNLPNFNIYPNPTGGQLYVKSSDNIISIQIIDGLGKVVIDEQQYKLEEIIDLSKLSAGIYFLKLKTKNTSNEIKVIKY